MNPDGFLKALGVFPSIVAGSPVKALVSLWNWEMHQAIGTIAPSHLLFANGVPSAPWFTTEFMKWGWWQPEWRWTKRRGEFDWMLAKAHSVTYVAMMIEANQLQPSRPCISSGSVSGEGSITPWSHGRRRWTLGNPLWPFADKIDHIHSDLDSGIGTQKQAMQGNLSPILWDTRVLSPMTWTDLWASKTHLMCVWPSSLIKTGEAC